MTSAASGGGALCTARAKGGDDVTAARRACRLNASCLSALLSSEYAATHCALADIAAALPQGSAALRRYLAAIYGRLRRDSMAATAGRVRRDCVLGPVRMAHPTGEVRGIVVL